MVRAWIGWFVALNLLWLLLVSSFVVAEQVLGLAASAVAATAAVAVGRQRLIRFRPRLRWLYAYRRLPLRAVSETWLVLGALLRQLAGGRPARGRFFTVPVSLPEDPDQSATKRALLTAGESFPPNSYVLEIDTKQGLMLVHRLVPDPGDR
jgi:multisubunit Na+/H+ antiporter MnhE subunit